MKLEEKEAIYGKKMIEIKVRFWTDGIAETENKVIPKNCWDSGVVRIKPNDLHGIKSSKPVIFHSLPEILPKIESILQANNIKLHHCRKSTKYYTFW